MQDVVLLEGARTPLGNFGGGFREINAPALLEHAFQGALTRAGVAPHAVDQVIVGQVFQGSDAPNIARFSARHVGVPDTVPGITLNRQCASGLEAAVWAAKDIQAGESELVLTGGVESMSTVPYIMRGARWGLKLGPQFLVDGLAELYDDPSAAGMWIWAENMAEKYEVSREEQDRWSLISHRRATAAAESGRLGREIVPYEIAEKRGARVIERDEGPRADTSLERLARLQPRFKWDGTITPGNASPLNDGACATLFASSGKASALGLKPLVRLVSWAIVGVDPEITGYAPVYAIPAALGRARSPGGNSLTLSDVGLFEVNEAFAVMMVTTIRELGLDPEKVNVNGGGIALGHPVGCSGNRLLLTLAYEMRQRGVEYGVASLCAGGGMGIAAVLQNLG